MNDVAIIGVGLHPFGRFEGKSAMEMANFRRACTHGEKWAELSP